MSGESLANTLFLISYASFALAAICLVLAVVFFFKFDIPSVIGDLSGRTVRKSIEKMREENTKNKKNVLQNNNYNVKYPSKIEKNSDKVSTNSNIQPETGVLEENKIKDLKNKSEETELLEGETETISLDENDETISLEDEETATLSLEDVVTAPLSNRNGIQLRMLEEIKLIHTDEIIE